MDPTYQYQKTITGISLFKTKGNKCSESEYKERSIFHFIKSRNQKK